MLREKCVPCSSDGSEVAFSDPSVPVVLQNAERGVVVLVLAKRPFIDNGGITSVVKYAWSDPGLCEVCVIATDVQCLRVY